MSTPPSPAPAPFDPVAFLLAGLNQINPGILLPLSESNVTITNPTPTDESAATDATAPAINTTATLTAVNGQGFEGTAQIYYQRQTPQAYLTSIGQTGSALTLSAVGIANWATFFAAFNAAYNTVFTEVDYPSTPYVAPTVDGALTVTLNTASLLFVGSMSVMMTDVVAPALSSVLSDAPLPGLVAPAHAPTPAPSPTPPSPSPTPPSPSPTPTPSPTPPTPTPSPSPAPTPELSAVVTVTDLPGLNPPISLATYVTHPTVTTGLTLAQLQQGS